jgi:hypothetical protein
VKIVTEKDLKKAYQDLQKDRVHQNCSCPSCLYHFVKSQNNKTRIDKDNFFLYWLAHVCSYTKDEQRSSKFLSRNKDRAHEWSEIFRLFKKLTGKEWKVDHIEEEREHFRIISRYDKKFNLSGIINARNNERICAPIEISWFMFELENIFEIMRQRTKYDFPFAYSLSPKDLERAFSEFFKPLFKFVAKTIEYLEDKLKEKEQISQREISRKFHAKRDDLMLLLGYLEFRKIIIWDKKNKKISLNPERLFWYKRFDRDIHRIFDGIKEMAPFSIRDAKEIFDETAEYTLKLYEQARDANSQS